MIPEGLRSAWTLFWETDPDQVREWLVGFGAWAPLASAALQIASSLIPVLPGFVLAIANAMIYGAVLGGALTFSSALVAAACCFGIARVVGRPGIERIVSKQRLERVDGFMLRRGMLAVFLGRLIPFINPDIVSYAAGATAIGWVPFLLAMGAGALPATVFYSAVGAAAGETSGAVVVMVTLATLLPLGILWLFRRRLPWPFGERARASSSPTTSSQGDGLLGG